MAEDSAVAALAPGSSDMTDRIARAEDARRIRDVPRQARASRDPAVRRASARALARILDADDAPLLQALEDEDDESLSWAAFGLGESCSGSEATHVRALAARLLSLSPDPASLRGGDGPLRDDGGLGALQGPISTILWAIGHCGGELAAGALVPWLRAAPLAAEAAAYALGEVVARRGSLLATETTALLDAAQGAPPLDAAMYALGRVEGPPRPELADRLVSAVRAALARPGPMRIFAVRARGRAGDPAAPGDLLAIVTSDDATVPERVEAARALARLSKAGQNALAEALVGVAPRTAGELLSNRFAVVLTILEGLAGEMPASAEPALWGLARLETRPNAPAALLRRASRVRCSAALRLARGAWDSDVLTHCDVGDGQAAERSQIEALDQRAIGPAGRAAWSELARSPHVRVREAALELVARHIELADAARAALAAGVSAIEPGVVATAARVIAAHPDRVFVAARRAGTAREPPSPDPQGSPQELDPAVKQALRAAIARPLRPDGVQTRLALIDAVLATGLAEGPPYAETACKDPNGTVRAHAAKALAILATAEKGDAGGRCAAPDEPQSPAGALGHEPAGLVRMTFDTDSGLLAVRLDPRFSPIAVARIVSLARSGFYDGTSFHRVVPGSVVQFGDPGGDGYGGSGDLLRSETAPVPWGALDVGVAMAGRDTGSSQLFVALVRSPHWDGQFAWVGRAEGDWNAVAEGDAIRSVRVDP